MKAFRWAGGNEIVEALLWNFKVQQVEEVEMVVHHLDHYRRQAVAVAAPISPPLTES